MVEEQKIEKPWAVYKGTMFSPIGVGLIVKEAERGTLYIQYSERDSEECWDPTYVSRFGTPTEAASYFVERREGVLEEKLNRLYGNFPKFIKKEKLEELHNLLVQRRNMLIAQSSPKCTTFGKNRKLIKRHTIYLINSTKISAKPQISLLLTFTHKTFAQCVLSQPFNYSLNL